MIAEIWTKPNCPYCDKAKTLFKIKGVEYNEKILQLTESQSNNLRPNQELVSRDALLEKAPNAKTVPQIWLDNNYIGGYSELAAFWNVP